MDEFQCKYDEMEVIAKAFQAQADVAQQLYDSIRNTMEDLKPDWIGKGSDAFYNEMESEINPALQRLIQALEEGGNVVLQINQTVETAEQEAQSQFTFEV